jgi:hypothetical protein
LSPIAGVSKLRIADELGHSLKPGGEKEERYDVLGAW